MKKKNPLEVVKQIIRADIKDGYIEIPENADFYDAEECITDFYNGPQGCYTFSDICDNAFVSTDIIKAGMKDGVDLCYCNDLLTEDEIAEAIHNYAVTNEGLYFDWHIVSEAKELADYKNLSSHDYVYKYLAALEVEWFGDIGEMSSWDYLHVLEEGMYRYYLSDAIYDVLEELGIQR